MLNLSECCRADAFLHILQRIALRGDGTGKCWGNRNNYESAIRHLFSEQELWLPPAVSVPAPAFPALTLNGVPRAQGSDAGQIFLFLPTQSWKARGTDQCITVGNTPLLAKVASSFLSQLLVFQCLKPRQCSLSIFSLGVCLEC